MTSKIFFTLYAIYGFAWISMLPMIQCGMGPNKPHHIWWRDFTDKMMVVVLSLTGITILIHLLLWIWS